MTIPRVRAAALAVGAIASIVVFGVRVPYSRVSYVTIMTLQLTALALLAWWAGASRIVRGSGNERLLATVGTLLLTPCVLFALVPGLGPPWLATAEENQRRYVILLVDTLAISGGLIVLAFAVREVGERFYSALCLAATILAGPSSVVWASILVAASYTRGQAAEIPIAMAGFVSDLSDSLLFIAGLMTYLGTAAMAMALRRAGWLGRTAARVCAAVSIGLAVCLALRGIRFPEPDIALATWYIVPGFVAGIPAIPWLVPICIGITLLSWADQMQSDQPRPN
jgi:hypothetical protein